MNHTFHTSIDDAARSCYNSSKFLLVNQLGMKNSVIAFSAASVLVISLIVIGTFTTGIVSALTATTTDATSTAQMFDSTIVRAHVSAAGAKAGRMPRRSGVRAAAFRRKSI